MSRSSDHPPHGLNRLGVAGAGAALAVLAAGLGIAGCGKIGPLEQPAPLFGAQAKAQYKADQQQAQAGAQPSSSPRDTTGSAERQVDAEANGVVNSMDNEEDDAPRTTRDVPDPDTQMTTPRDSPVPGEPNPGGPMPSLTPPNR